jgi:hypothetical protein
LGFRGISDLHAQTELSVKGKIKDAALASPLTVHIIEPLTFADPREGWAFTPTENTIFSTVITPRQHVQILGESRAWYPANRPVPAAATVALNNPNPGCESKAYQDYYTRGESGSASALMTYHNKTRRRLFVTVTNNLVFNNRVLDRAASTSAVRVEQFTTRHNEAIAQPAIKWVPDVQQRQCFGCQTLFTLFTRKHHCRRCGEIFCDACAPKRTVSGRPTVRLCNPCV